MEKDVANNSMEKVKMQFERSKAAMKRIVASQDQKITEIFDRVTISEIIVPNLNYLYKVRLTDRTPPLRISVLFTDQVHNRNVIIYESFDHKEPNAHAKQKVHHLAQAENKEKEASGG